MQSGGEMVIVGGKQDYSKNIRWNTVEMLRKCSKET